MEHIQVDTGHVHIAMDLRREVPEDEGRQCFPELSPGHEASDGDDTVTAPTWADQVTQQKVASTSSFVPSASTWVTGLSSMGQDTPLHLGQM